MFLFIAMMTTGCLACYASGLQWSGYSAIESWTRLHHLFVMVIPVQVLSTLFFESCCQYS